MNASSLSAMVHGLLAEAGREAVWTSYTESFDPATGTASRTPAEQTMRGAFVSRSHSLAEGLTTSVRERVFIASARGLAGTPVPGDRLGADGEDFTVERVETVAAKGTALLHKLVLAL